MSVTRPRPRAIPPHPTPAAKLLGALEGTKRDYEKHGFSWNTTLEGDISANIRGLSFWDRDEMQRWGGGDEGEGRKLRGGKPAERVGFGGPCGGGGAVEGCCGVGAGGLHEKWEVYWWHVDDVHC